VSPCVRVYIVTGVAALAAAGIAVGVAWTGRGEEAPAAATAQGGPREGAPPLALDVLVDDANEAVALDSAITLYEGGRRQAALSAFEDILEHDPGSLYAAVGAAFARWPDGTLARLEQLAAENPTSGLVRLHEGLALLWQGKDAEARAAWQEAERVNPDSPAAIRAESLLHPDMPAGRPFFVPSGPVPQELAGLPLLAQLDELERRAETATEAEPWIRYGAALQRAGRPISAREAFDRAVAVDPESVEARTAAAVIRFDKDDPSQAFSRLGPLSAQHPNDAVVRFHLGLGLLWLRGVDEAREQLEAAKASGAGTIYGREAAILLERLAESSR
jgi:tetratricopeptide (TPR) repeat protein